MRVAILSAEAVPYSKTGGLGDVAGALPKALKKIGVDVALITPCYLQTKAEYLWQLAIDDLWINWRGINYKAKVFYSEANGSPTFLIDAPEFFHRSSIYGFREDYERFALFSYAALQLLKRLGPPPDIVHLNDWHTGFAAVKLATLRFHDSYWQKTHTVFSIHNLAYQGAFDVSELWHLGFDSDFEKNAFLLNGYACAMKAAIAVADLISTVSHRYSQEIQTPESGYGLDWLLRLRSNRLFGIVNGIDYEVWNPETDPAIPAHYSMQDLSGKAICKKYLLEIFGLSAELEKPVFASISRLTAQKGIDLIMQVANEILSTGAYFIALGSGEWHYENFWQRLRDYAPRQVGVYIGYNEDLAHKIEAGADIFLMPSRFEPCGLNQMYSLRYGTVPIVHAVGGLDDTIKNFDAVNLTGNGFKFRGFSADAFLEKIYEALFFYYDKEMWQRIQLNGMSEDHSWENSAHKYLQLYRFLKN